MCSTSNQNLLETYLMLLSYEKYVYKAINTITFILIRVVLQNALVFKYTNK